jgi:hypothetical protein
MDRKGGGVIPAFEVVSRLKSANLSECVAKQAENHKLKPHNPIKFNSNAMQMCIYIGSCFLTIIRSCIVKVVKLFLFLKGFATEKWLFWWVSYTKSRGYPFSCQQ